MMGNASVMSPEEIRSTIIELQKRIAAARQKEIKVMGEKILLKAGHSLNKTKEKKG